MPHGMECICVNGVMHFAFSRILSPNVNALSNYLAYKKNNLESSHLKSTNVVKKCVEFSIY